MARRKKHGPDVPASALQALTAAQEFHNALAWAKDGDPRLLRTILAERGFSYYERDALVRALAPAKKGPGRPRKVTRVTRWAKMLTTSERSCARKVYVTRCSKKPLPR